MSIRCRSALPSDAPACVDILRAWIDETPWMPMLHSHASMVGFWGARIAENPAWVAAEGARVQGFCVRVGGMITALYLAADIRCRGVGRQLLDEARCDMARVDLWAFQANTAALRFYGRHGFVEVDRTDGDNEEGLPDIRLAWRRAAPSTQAG